MNIISKSENLKGLNLTATRMSETHIQFKLDGVIIHEWHEECLKTDDDIWYAFEINGVMYDVNFFGGEYSLDEIYRISFYGLYEEPNEDGEMVIHTIQNDWYTIPIN